METRIPWKVPDRIPQQYKVTWEIEVDALSPKEAAQEALKIMWDKESTALHFIVENQTVPALYEIDLFRNTKIRVKETIDSEGNKMNPYAYRVKQLISLGWTRYTHYPDNRGVCGLLATNGEFFSYQYINSLSEVQYTGLILRVEKEIK